VPHCPSGFAVDAGRGARARVGTGPVGMVRAAVDRVRVLAGPVGTVCAAVDRARVAAGPTGSVRAAVDRAPTGVHRAVADLRPV
jgi:hypothetical protein